MHSPCGSSDPSINLFCSERQLVNKLLGIEKSLWEAVVRISADPHGRRLIFLAVPSYFNGEEILILKSKLCLYLIPLSCCTGSCHGRERRRGRETPVELKTRVGEKTLVGWPAFRLPYWGVWSLRRDGFKCLLNGWRNLLFIVYFGTQLSFPLAYLISFFSSVVLFPALGLCSNSLFFLQ